MEYVLDEMHMSVAWKGKVERTEASFSFEIEFKKSRFDTQVK